VLNSCWGDPREPGKRQYNPHVLPFHHFSFEHFGSYWHNCSTYGFFIQRRRLEQVFLTIIAKMFHKVLDCEVRYSVTESDVKFLSPGARRGTDKFALHGK
jgi:hypothetical protein